jgi:hypothetical protein
MKRKSHYSRRFKLAIFACGAVELRDSLEKMAGPIGALPLFSTDTREQADALIARLCRLERTKDADGNSIYRVNDRPSGIEDLDALTEAFAAEYEEQLRRGAAGSAEAQ